MASLRDCISRSVATVACLLLAVVCLPVHLHAQEIRFLWGFGVLSDVGSDRKLTAITDDVTLHTGDEIKFFVSPLTACYIYLLHEDPRNRLELLYPTGASFAEGPAAVGSKHYIPSGRAWLALDAEIGIERIYLIASTTRLITLEDLISQHAAAPAANRAPIVRQVIAELARLQKQHRSRGWSERPVTMGGQVRSGARPDVSEIALEISHKLPFFSRVFIIDHR
jgi:hypothetical protein